ncbi:GDSL-type esterase/lipase family protein [Streptomyces sp. NPDC048197]|uniref:GDSL-type esterase/lipase family protein n=1 Tax=Streptomyces sp. NPDC048197 TaxID=3365511 RepID=UPI00371DC70B
MRILVLGDSCSAGIGAPQTVYPSVLHKILGEAHRIENHAVPGFTSADAARYFRRSLAHGRWDVVIVYLGNTDGAQSRYKGSYKPWRDRARWLPRRQPKRPIVRIQQKNKGQFDERDERLSVATTPQDFRKNLESIVRPARRRGIRVILVNPIANTRFPAAMMASNASFYKVVGLDARLADDLAGRSEESCLLIDAIRDHENGNLTSATEKYRKLAQEESRVSPIARNNLAVLLDQQGAEDEPVAVLEKLADNVGAAGAVAAYNLSRLLTRKNQEKQAQSYARRAVESDSNLYRIKSEYRRTITALSAQMDVEVLDLASLLTPADFFDYCHPTAQAHERIAAALAERLARGSGGSTTERDAGYLCVYPSPDAFFDVGPTLADHFSLDFDVLPADVRDEAQKVLQSARELGTADFLTGEPDWPEPASDLQANIINTFRYAAEHPLITSLDDLKEWLPEYGWEIGRFPEYYVCRILHDYAIAAETSGVDGGAAMDAVTRHLSSAVQRQRVLPRFPPKAASRLRIDVAYGWRVLEKTQRKLLSSDALFDDSRALRIVTVRNWYLREAFRFGAHSRYGMFYPAWDLERLIEGVCVSLTIFRHRHDDESADCAASLLDKLVQLRDVHEKYAIQHVQAGELAGREEYRAELAQLRIRFDVSSGTQVP